MGLYKKPLRHLDDDDDEAYRNSCISYLSSISGEMPVASAPWSEDKVCRICKKKLSKLAGNRRHHCRFCGSAVCNDHSQHRRKDPLVDEFKRSCDKCEKVLVGKDVKEEIERRIRTLKAQIQGEKGDVERRVLEKETRITGIIELKNELKKREITSSTHLKALQDRLAAHITSNRRVKDMVKNIKSAAESASETLNTTSIRHAERKAEQSELAVEIGNLNSDIRSLEAEIYSKEESRRGRIPEKDLGHILCHVCRPKYDGVSFQNASLIDPKQMRSSLFSDPRSSLKFKREICKCSVF